MQFVTLASLLACSISVVAGAATTTFPNAAGQTTLSTPKRITGTFDGGMLRYGRGIPCDTDADGGEEGAVFILAEGATLKNAIIGADQLEGVHCSGACTIQNVWWEDVCEDALTILQPSGTSKVIGGGARGAKDKVIQHNGLGTVQITDFFVDNFGKLWRSCGNCSNNKGPRKVEINGVVAKGGKVLAGVNSNYGDSATIRNTCGADPTKMCESYNGCDKAKGSCDAVKIGPGFNGVSCIDGGNNKATC